MTTPTPTRPILEDPAAAAPALPAPAPGDSATWPHAAPDSPARPSPALSARDNALITALTSPTRAADALLASWPPSEQADFYDRPEVQRALAAAETSRDTRLRARAAQRLERSMDRLDAVLDHAQDLTNEAQRTDTRRAASVLARQSSLIYHGTRAASLRARADAPPSSPPGGGPSAAASSRRAKGEGAVSPRSSLPVSTAQLAPDAEPFAPEFTRRGGPLRPSAPSSSPPHLRTTSPPELFSPCSTVPGLKDLVARYIRAMNDEHPTTPPALLIAQHRRQELGPGLDSYLDSHARTLRGATPCFGPAIYQDDLGTAVQHVTLALAPPLSAAHPSALPSPMDCLVYAVLERHSHAGDGRWRIADLIATPRHVTNDTS